MALVGAVRVCVYTGPQLHGAGAVHAAAVPASASVADQQRRNGGAGQRAGRRHPVDDGRDHGSGSNDYR